MLAEVDLRSVDEDGLTLCVGAAIACTATTATGLRQREKANRIGAVRCSSERPQGKLTRIPGSQVTSHGPVRAKAVPLRPAKPTDPMWAHPSAPQSPSSSALLPTYSARDRSHSAALRLSAH